MNPHFYDSAALEARREAVRVRLVAEAEKFLTEHREAAGLTVAEAAQLRADLQQHGLVRLNRELRLSIGAMPDTPDYARHTEPRWDLIDATGFWEDALVGNWPLMTHASLMRKLDWAEQYAAGTAFLQEPASTAA